MSQLDATMIAEQQAQPSLLLNPPFPSHPSTQESLRSELKIVRDEMVHYEALAKECFERVQRLENAIDALDGVAMVAKPQVTMAAENGNEPKYFPLEKDAVSSTPRHKIRRNKERLPKAPKRAETGSSQLVSDLKAGWHSLADLVKASGLKELTIRSMLSKLKAKARGGRGSKEYRL